MASQAIRWRRPIAVVRKFDENGILRNVVVAEGNILTNAGMGRLINLITGESGVEPLTAESVRLGVGDSNAAATVEDTDLSEGSNQWFAEIDDGYPVVDGSTIVYRATFGVDDANFTWACWGLDVTDSPPATSGNTPNELFNRKVFNFGTKSGGIWDLSVIIGLTQ